MSYDPNNIFGKILRGEIPCHRIYETDAVLAFMDVMPQVEGHCLVVPKAESRHLLDADENVLGALMVAVQRVARAAVTAMGADGFQLRQFNEAAAGQTVFHLHFHVLPIKEGTGVRPHTGQMADNAVLAAQAEKIRAALAVG